MDPALVFELTHLMHSDMPVYPGKGKPRISAAASLDTDGYRELRIELDGHTGTHMDAPAHMLQGGMTLDKYPASHFTGEALLMDIPEGTCEISLSFLQKREENMAGLDYLLFRTGWSSLWEHEEYLRNFPVLSVEAAGWLAGKSLKGIGLDAISVDPVESDTWPVHHILFGAGMVLVENLLFPPGMKEGRYFFCALPLRLLSADGSPVRAIAMTLPPGVD
ncbi:MAG TPA: cyclase family protein [Prolixibacteraceae bacterium]|nr:cyclase family protein [Prolixibacteraceae bacterium]